MLGLRAATLLTLGSLSACAGSDAAACLRMPDWRGPAVTCVHRVDGAMTVEMTVPVGGHQLALTEVAREGAVATARLVYAPPTGDLVPQVITTLRVEIPAEQLGDAAAVLVEIGTSGGGRPQLAVATSRPPR